MCICTTGPPGTPMNIRISGITSTSFVVQWDEVDDAKLYCVQWRDDGGSVRSRESKPPRTSITITQLSPNTTYNVTAYVTAGNICETGPVSDILIVTTNMTILVGPLSSMLTMATPTSSSSVITTTPSEFCCSYDNICTIIINYTKHKKNSTTPISNIILLLEVFIRNNVPPQ